MAVWTTIGLPGEVRVQVCARWPLERLGDAFFEPPRSILWLWGYLLSDGFREVALKVRSRLREKLRNRRFFCLGGGGRRGTGDGGQPPDGDGRGTTDGGQPPISRAGPGGAGVKSAPGYRYDADGNLARRWSSPT